MARVELTNEDAEKIFCDEYFFASCNEETRRELGLLNPNVDPHPPENGATENRNVPKKHDGPSSSELTIDVEKEDQEFVYA